MIFWTHISKCLTLFERNFEILNSKFIMFKVHKIIECKVRSWKFMLYYKFQFKSGKKFNFLIRYCLYDDWKHFISNIYSKVTSIYIKSDNLFWIKNLFTWKCLIPLLDLKLLRPCNTRLLLKHATSPGLRRYSILNNYYFS